MKSYTDLEQSKKLAEFLPLESADMFYNGVQDLDKKMVFNIPIDGRTITVRTGHIITETGIKANLILPCWSLATLMNVLERGASFKTSQGWVCQAYTGSKAIISNYYNNPVDACVDMIVKLHEQKLL